MNLDNSTPKDYKDRTPILLARVSTTGQKEALPTQVKYLKKEAKALGFSKEPVVIAIQQSGKKADQKTLRQMKKIITENPRKKFVVIVRDTPRFARDVNQAIDGLAFLTEQGIPLIPLDTRNPTFNQGSPTRKMVFTVLAAVAEGGKAPEQAALQTAVKERAEQGVPPSPPQDSYNEKTKGKPNIYRQINALRPAIAEGSISRNKAAAAVGLLPQQFRKMLKKLEFAEEIGGPEKVKEWLEVWDAIVAAERTRGIGKMKDYASVRSKTRALHRVVIGYLRFPDKFPRPDTVGNPMTATKRSPERTGTIQDALENSEFYQPTR